MVEYGTKGDGLSQVVGGRWKPLMHLLESSLYRDVIAACGQNFQCYVRNDGMARKNLTVHFEAWDLLTFQCKVAQYSASLDSGTIGKPRLGIHSMGLSPFSHVFCVFAVFSLFM